MNSAESLQNLKRYPIKKNDLLQAWDAADELMLEHLSTMDLNSHRILVVQDHFGAISCALQNQALTSYTDSFVSTQAIQMNSNHQVKTIHRLSELDGHYSLVLIPLPKNQSFFEDILATLTHHLAPQAQFICSGMVKHMAKSSFDLLQTYIGPTTTSLAKKKARLIFAQFSKAAVKSPYPLRVKIPPFETPFTHHSNLFSREKLDIGTRFFLEHIPQGNFESILDLGCANGIVGIVAQKKNPQAHLIFSDESEMAVLSARENYGANFEQKATFLWTNGYENQEPESLDLVLCNPPFHQSNAMGDFIAWQMFADAHFSLKKRGLLRVIGNTHLGYPQKLKRMFGNSTIVAQNAKFTIVDALK